MSSDSRPADATHESVGLPEGQRYRCADCGNLTRFDVAVTETSTRFWHVDLAGRGHVERTDVAEQTIDRVTCHWCATGGTVLVEPLPVGSEVGSDGVGSDGAGGA